ncbi:uridine phosphorylase 1-like isoform X2 [Plodia interpunctella]|uniref:uridine phosphorylase 1-like isoform X2 n=1 Tax=Plodia interpunctella TaxID=58824 RepID=UPI002367A5C7|nr:uridine phosphorylase 1-like isoform X2 [Plodia interpunctella]
MCDCDNILPQGLVEEKHYFNCKSIWKGDTVRYPDGTLCLQNKNISDQTPDYLYHLSLGTDDDLKALFGDVKFVCTGGTEHRIRAFALYMARLLNLPYSEDHLVNLTATSKRYAMFKVGPVLAFNHGIGIPSMTTALQEVIKLLFHAKVKDPLIFRLGSSGGVGVEPGNVVISAFGMNGLFEKNYISYVLGKERRYPSCLDARLAQELQSMSSPDDGFETIIGGTLAADDYYRGQGRLDGPFCDYTEADKMAFLQKLRAAGVRNIEMEATAFAAFTHQAGVRAAIVCVALLNRFNGDQITTPKKTLEEYENNLMKVVGRYIQTYEKSKGKQ